MITLTMQDEKRLDIIQRVYRGELTVVQAALVMGVSERQCFGVGFVHDNCLPMLREKSIRWLEMTPEFGTMDISIIYKKSVAITPACRALIDALTPTRIRVRKGAV